MNIKEAKIMKDNPLLIKLNNKGSWHLYFDVKEVENGDFRCKYARLTRKPTLAEIKEIVLSWMNSEIDKKILDGFVWNGMAVWLSSENQFNYKAAYDLAVQTEGLNLPVTFKFGTTDEPVYHEFTTVEELTDFYTKAMAYINTQLAEGWAAKDAVDWSPYVLALGE